VVEGVAAAGVGGDHPAERAGRGTGRVRSEAAADLLQLRVQVVQHDARLDGHRVGADREDAAEVDGEVEDERGAERLTGQPGAGPARDDRDGVLVAVADQRRDALGVLRHRDGQRRDLEGAGVGGVQSARQRVEAQPPPEEPAQVVGDLLLVEHGREGSWVG
jgi:hypothetical protein